MRFEGYLNVLFFVLLSMCFSCLLEYLYYTGGHEIRGLREANEFFHAYTLDVDGSCDLWLVTLGSSRKAYIA